MNGINHQIAEALSRIRQTKPLVHHITNLVVMNDTANVTLHVGALPVMSRAPEEVGEMVRMAGALVLNPGTLTTFEIESMFIAGQAANELGIPIVLDPVGAGATRFRLQMNERLLNELRISILRGNAGEIGALSGVGGEVKGVESIKGVDDPAAVARAMAHQREMVIAIGGKRDILSDGKRILGVDNGHPWLTTITGTGCMATTMIAAFAAVERDYLIAAAGGLACFGLAAEMASLKANGPASFKLALLDQIYHLSPEQLSQGARVVELHSEI